MKKRPDGRVVKTFLDPRTKKRVYIYARSERELNRKIFEYNAKSERGRYFSDVADEWWSAVYDGLAYQTIKVYKPALKRAIDEFGNEPIKDILPRDISTFLKRLAAYYKFSKRTIANQRTIINQIMEHAVIENDIQYNPCASVQVPQMSKAAKRGAASSTDEEIIKKSADIWIFPFIAIYTGMRKGEILALQWKDIDFEKEQISVTKSVYHEGDRPYVKEPKTVESNRLIPLLEPLKEALLTLRRADEDFIVSDDGKKPLTNRRYLTLYSNFKAVTGITCTAHQLRHSFATIAIESGVPMKSVQEILGHQHISTTLDIYTDFRAAALKEAKASLNKAFKKNT